MPQKETIAYKAGPTTIREACTNITFSVGINGDNGQADVMLIQTLFNYIGKKNSVLLGTTALPVITGRIDEKTTKAILSFQHANRDKLLRIDGLIEPAKYEGRVIEKLNGRLMTITLLDLFARQEGLMKNDADHIAGMIKIEPRLGPWLV